MSHYCKRKVRTTFRRSKLSEGNVVHPIGYPDPTLKWKLVLNWKKAQKAAMKEQAS